jgi:hypothetical protein
MDNFLEKKYNTGLVRCHEPPNVPGTNSLGPKCVWHPAKVSGTPKEHFALAPLPGRRMPKSSSFHPRSPWPALLPDGGAEGRAHAVGESPRRFARPDRRWSLRQQSSKLHRPPAGRRAGHGRSASRATQTAQCGSHCVWRLQMCLAPTPWFYPAMCVAPIRSHRLGAVQDAICDVASPLQLRFRFLCQLRASIRQHLCSVRTFPYALHWSVCSCPDI